MAGGKVDLYLHGWGAQFEHGKYWYDTILDHFGMQFQAQLALQAIRITPTAWRWTQHFKYLPFTTSWFIVDTTDCTIFPPQSTAILCGEKLSSRRGKPCFPRILIEAVNHLFYLFIRWYIMRVYVQVSDRSSRNSGTMLQASDNMPIICLERLRWWNWRRWELHKPKAQLRFRFTLQVWMV